MMAVRIGDTMAARATITEMVIVRSNFGNIITAFLWMIGEELHDDLLHKQS